MTGIDDYFAVFGLPRKLTVDGEALRARFYELSRAHHPDFHQGADADAQAKTLARSALVNRAYRALRDPLARVEYRELLAEMMDVQEALEEAKAGGMDEAARARLREERERLRERKRTEEEAIIGRAADWDAALGAGADRRPLLEWFKARLAARAYLRTVIDDLSDALGEDLESHVSHRRH